MLGRSTTVPEFPELEHYGLGLFATWLQIGGVFVYVNTARPLAAAYRACQEHQLPDTVRARHS